MNKTIVHISENDINELGGMSRVEYHFRNAFINAECNFIHIGKKEVGNCVHRFFFGIKAALYLRSLKIKPDAIIVHEPYGMWFLRFNCKIFLESHGLERRFYNDSYLKSIFPRPSIKTRILFPIWRIIPCDMSVKKADYLLLINEEDKRFAIEYYKRRPNECYVIKNGYNLIEVPKDIEKKTSEFIVLFNGSWILRKGFDVLINAAKILIEWKYPIRYLIIGTGITEEKLLSFWPEELRKNVKTVDSFNQKEELEYLEMASVFVLPSYFEGQPLSLLQAMSQGKCCIATNADGQKDIIIDRKNGLLFQRGDYLALANLIKECFDNPNLCSDMGLKARTTVSGRNWKNVSSELVNFVLEKTRT